MFLAAAAIGICLLVTVPLAMRARHTFPALNERSAAAWHSYGGEWNLADDVYSNRADGRGDKLVGGPASLGDYAVSSLLRFDTAPGDPSFGDAGILLRVLDPAIGVDAHRGYYAALRPDDHALLIGSMNFYFRELATTPFPHELHSGRWYRLTFTARACTFFLHAEDTETHEMAELSYVERDCSPRRGQIGLRSYYAKASWRDLQVTSLP